MNRKMLVLGGAALALAAAVSPAAPLLDIRSIPGGGPVIPSPVGPTGPVMDPLATQGQWFSDGRALPNEFYDNVAGFGGGVAGSLAIEGIVQNIVFGGGGNILSFDVLATIRNDLPGFGNYLAGANAHGEIRPGGVPTLARNMGVVRGDVRMTVEFAITAAGTLPPGGPPWPPPYFDYQPYIQAVGEDTAAWYCWSPGAGNPPGGYYVPTWYFDPIPLGSSDSEVMLFTVTGGGIPVGDARYAPIVNSQANNLDIFANRTTGLKIDSWLDGVIIDNGAAYGLPNLSENGNVSVFEVPEPTTLAGLLLGLAVAWRRRRTA